MNAKAKRLTLSEERCKAYNEGVDAGQRRERVILEKQFSQSKAHSQTEILKAGAELAQANAKLTYALSRMINEKGW